MAGPERIAWRRCLGFRHQEADQNLRTIPASHFREHERPLGGILSTRVEVGMGSLHLMAAERAFIMPLVIDRVHDADALVPDRFREVQWTSCPAGQVSAEFVARVARLLSPDVPQTPSAVLRTPPKPAIAPARGRASGRRAMIVGISAAALIAVGVLAVYKRGLQNKTISMVAVLPFENATGDPANE